MTHLLLTLNKPGGEKEGKGKESKGEIVETGNTYNRDEVIHPVELKETGSGGLSLGSEKHESPKTVYLSESRSWKGVN